jgi:DNA-binding GntR family transcriptional regulator
MKPPTTLHEDVYKRLKAMIIARQLPPGAKLVLRAVAKQLGTSTMPVLEAVRRLEHDGLLVQIPKWGAFVKEWSADEQLEALHIRRALEGEAARLFVMRASDDQKHELVRLNAVFDEAAREGLLEGLEADVALHLHIAKSTAFRRLAHMVEIARIPLTMIMKSGQQSGSSGKRINVVGCHAGLVRTLLGGDPELAVQAMWDHVDGIMSSLNTGGQKTETLTRRTAAAESPQATVMVR